MMVRPTVRLMPLGRQIEWRRPLRTAVIVFKQYWEYR